jgi:protochlorophyllide reductase
MIRLTALFLAASTAAAFTSPSAGLYRATRTSAVVDSAPRSLVSTSTELYSASVKDFPTKKLYNKSSEKEMPKVLGGLKIGLRELVVITGASSGLGLNCAVKMAKSGKYFVVMAVRDVEKAARGTLAAAFLIYFSPCSPTLTRMVCTVAKQKGMPDGSYVALKLELGSLDSVRDFVSNLKAFKSARPLNHLILNAAVYRPTDPVPAFTDDGFEMSIGVNHLSQFLLVNLLMEDMARAKNSRCCIVGSITGNTNTVGGGLVYPQADLGSLKGMEKGMKEPISMVDGKPFFGAKAYKDSKVIGKQI